MGKYWEVHWRNERPEMKNFILGTVVSDELFATILPGKARDRCQKKSWNSPGIKGGVNMV